MSWYPGIAKGMGILSQSAKLSLKLGDLENYKLDGNEISTAASGGQKDFICGPLLPYCSTTGRITFMKFGRNINSY